MPTAPLAAAQTVVRHAASALARAPDDLHADHAVAATTTATVLATATGSAKPSRSRILLIAASAVLATALAGAAWYSIGRARTSRSRSGSTANQDGRLDVSTLFEGRLSAQDAAFIVDTFTSLLEDEDGGFGSSSADIDVGRANDLCSELPMSVSDAVKLMEAMYSEHEPSRVTAACLLSGLLENADYAAKLSPLLILPLTALEGEKNPRVLLLLVDMVSVMIRQDPTMAASYVSRDDLIHFLIQLVLDPSRSANGKGLAARAHNTLMRLISFAPAKAPLLEGGIHKTIAAVLAHPPEDLSKEGLDRGSDLLELLFAQTSDDEWCTALPAWEVDDPCELALAMAESSHTRLVMTGLNLATILLNGMASIDRFESRADRLFELVLKHTQEYPKTVELTVASAAFSSEKLGARFLAGGYMRRVATMESLYTSESIGGLDRSLIAFTDRAAVLEAIRDTPLLTHMQAHIAHPKYRWALDVLLALELDNDSPITSGEPSCRRPAIVASLIEQCESMYERDPLAAIDMGSSNLFGSGGNSSGAEDDAEAMEAKRAAEAAVDDAAALMRAVHRYLAYDPPARSVLEPALWPLVRQLALYPATRERRELAAVVAALGHAPNPRLDPSMAASAHQANDEEPTLATRAAVELVTPYLMQVHTLLVEAIDLSTAAVRDHRSAETGNGTLDPSLVPVANARFESVDGPAFAALATLDPAIVTALWAHEVSRATVRDILSACRRMLEVYITDNEGKPFPLIRLADPLETYAAARQTRGEMRAGVSDRGDEFRADLKLANESHLVLNSMYLPFVFCATWSAYDELREDVLELAPLLAFAASRFSFEVVARDVSLVLLQSSRQMIQSLWELMLLRYPTLLINDPTDMRMHRMCSREAVFQTVACGTCVDDIYWADVTGRCLTGVRGNLMINPYHIVNTAIASHGVSGSGKYVYVVSASPQGCPMAGWTTLTGEAALAPSDHIGLHAAILGVDTCVVDFAHACAYRDGKMRYLNESLNHQGPITIMLDLDNGTMLARISSKKPVVVFTGLDRSATYFPVVIQPATTSSMVDFDLAAGAAAIPDGYTPFARAAAVAGTTMGGRLVARSTPVETTMAVATTTRPTVHYVPVSTDPPLSQQQLLTPKFEYYFEVDAVPARDILALGFAGGKVVSLWIGVRGLEFVLQLTTSSGLATPLELRHEWTEIVPALVRYLLVHVRTMGDERPFAVRATERTNVGRLGEDDEGWRKWDIALEYYFEPISPLIVTSWQWHPDMVPLPPLPASPTTSTVTTTPVHHHGVSLLPLTTTPMRFALGTTLYNNTVPVLVVTKGDATYAADVSALLLSDAADTTMFPVVLGAARAELALDCAAEGPTAIKGPRATNNPAAAMRGVFRNWGVTRPGDDAEEDDSDDDEDKEEEEEEGEVMAVVMDTSDEED
ncbi:hypothetical protein BC828DRAFT_387606 [Blastocladiella britannica]|nr:hypothetical protein BC828DRAFT_387606 [Blastocladiella britannica]